MNQAVLDQVRVFFDAIPFNRLLAMKLSVLEHGHAAITIPFKPEFVGDTRKKIVHGGVLSTLIDATGGATAFTVLEPPHETSLNTVDMRVDYVRMGRGAQFVADGHVVRKGSRIILTRIEVTDDRGELIAQGTATYAIFNESRTGPGNKGHDTTGTPKANAQKSG